MRAIVRHEYGPPGVLRAEEVEQPTAGEDEVLVRVHAASVNAGDWHLMRGDPFLVRLVLGGLLRPKHEILGADIAGRVEAVGSRVERFRPGDEVFGDLSGCGFGAFAEYARAPEGALARKPRGTTFEEAAAVPLAARAALQGLRAAGGVQPGMRVLVNGASGGVGTFAVQIARSFGAEVTGVCGTRNLDMVRAIGADHVIDYTQDDYTRNGERYDLVLDAAAYRPPSESVRALRPRGTYVMVGGATSRMLQTMLLGAWRSVRGGKRVRFLLSEPNHEDLVVVRDLVEAGKIAPVIDRRYELSQVPEAIHYLEAGHASGKVVITVEGRT